MYVCIWVRQYVYDIVKSSVIRSKLAIGDENFENDAFSGLVEQLSRDREVPALRLARPLQPDAHRHTYPHTTYHPTVHTYRSIHPRIVKYGIAHCRERPQLS